MAVKLRLKTDLRAKIDCSTRWLSTTEMLRRYAQLRDYISDIEYEQINSSIPNPRENRKIDTLCSTFDELDSVCKALQQDEMTCSDARALFDEAIEYHLETGSRLGSASSIVHQPVFKTAIVKLQEGRINQLTQDKSKSVETLRVQQTSTWTESDLINFSLAERALKRRRKNTESTNNYMDVRFVLPTSNVCERLFSTAGFSLSYRRGRILP